MELLDSVVLLFDTQEDAVRVSILAALNDFTAKCEHGARVLSQRGVTQKILTFLEVRFVLLILSRNIHFGYTR